jgi:hypothetical protein
LLLVALVAASRLVPAEEPTVRSDVDARKIGLEDVVQWSLTLEGSAMQVEEQVGVPPLKNLKVVGGPSVSTQVTLVNNRMSQRKVYTWVLQPTAAGTAEIGAVRVKHAGGETEAPPITIEVGPGSLRPRPPPRPASPFGPDPFEEMFGPRRPRVEGKLFVEAVPSRTRARVGEAILITYFIYTRGAQPTDMQSVGTPQYPGFWVENVESPEPPREEEVKVDGESFVRFPIHRRLLFPTKAGSLTIPALTLRIALAAQSLFDTGMVVERSTRPVKVTVEPLPPAEGFTGAVGRFTATATAEPAALRLGDAATVRFRVEGVGNLKWVEKGPELALEGAKVFPPQVKSSLQARVDGLAGSKTWEYVVVPETSGRLTIPVLTFAYFDPAEGRVVSAETSPLALEVQGATAAAGAPAASASALPRGRPAPALRDALDLTSPPFLVVPPRALGLLFLAAALLHGGLALGSRIGLGRGASARGAARAALRHLHRASEPGLPKEEAAALIEKALNEAFAAKDGQAEPERLAVVDRLVEEVQGVRYAPQLGDYSEKLKELVRRAKEAVERWA